MVDRAGAGLPMVHIRAHLGLPFASSSFLTRPQRSPLSFEMMRIDGLTVVAVIFVELPGKSRQRPPRRNVDLCPGH